MQRADTVITAALGREQGAGRQLRACWLAELELELERGYPGMEFPVVIHIVNFILLVRKSH